jgi:hypothetical protein
MRTTEWLAWPDNPLWSWQVTRIIGLADFGGSNFAEIFEAVQRITPHDDDSWSEQWRGLAERVAALAAVGETGGVTGESANSLYRACQYFRLSQLFVRGDDPRKLPLLHQMKGAFARATELSGHPLERVGIPYEGQLLPGYFLPGRGASSESGKRPTLMYLNGADSLSEEVFFTTGKAVQDFGYNILIFDAPGVGLTLYELGLPTRPDAEVFVSAAVDYVLSRDDVNPDRIGLLGESFAGYLVPRASTFEPRIRASVVWSPIYELDLSHVLEAKSDAFRVHLMRLIGATASDFAEKAKRYSLRGQLGALTSRMLLIQGSDDWLIPRPIDAALRIAREAPAGLVDVRIIERDEGLGGACHCQKDNLHIAHVETLAWFAREFR